MVPCQGSLEGEGSRDDSRRVAAARLQEKIYHDCRRQLILHGEAEPAGKAKGQERGPGAVCELS